MSPLENDLYNRVVASVTGALSWWMWWMWWKPTFIAHLARELAEKAVLERRLLEVKQGDIT